MGNSWYVGGLFGDAMWMFAGGGLFGDAMMLFHDVTVWCNWNWELKFSVHWNSMYYNSKHIIRWWKLNLECRSYGRHFSEECSWSSYRDYCSIWYANFKKMYVLFHLFKGGKMYFFIYLISWSNWILTGTLFNLSTNSPNAKLTTFDYLDGAKSDCCCLLLC